MRSNVIKGQHRCGEIREGFLKEESLDLTLKDEQGCQSVAREDEGPWSPALPGRWFNLVLILPVTCIEHVAVQNTFIELTLLTYLCPTSYQIDLEWLIKTHAIQQDLRRMDEALGTQTISWNWAKIFPQRTDHKVLNHKLLEGSKFGSELYSGWNKERNMIITKLTKQFT